MNNKRYLILNYFVETMVFIRTYVKNENSKFKFKASSIQCVPTKTISSVAVFSKWKVIHVVFDAVFHHDINEFLAASRRAKSFYASLPVYSFKWPQ